MDGYRITGRGLARWRALAGQAGIDAWCQLHELDSSSVSIDPGREPQIEGEFVTGVLFLTDENGSRYIDPGERRAAATPFARRLIAPPPPVALELIA